MKRVEIDHSVLKPRTRTTLANNQRKLDDVPLAEWDKKVELADKNWGRRPKGAFSDVIQHLRNASPGKRYCCYCQHDRAKEVEHVFNKKLFPERTFVFSNYVLTCHYCNGKKQDAFAVFDQDAGEEVTYFLKAGPRIRPVSTRNVFIDPRAENPRDFFVLNLSTGYLESPYEESSREYKKACYTLDLLELNIDRELPDLRLSAVQDYIHDLEKYIGARESASHSELQDFVPSKLFPIDPNDDLQLCKQNAMNHWANRLQTRHFPTIWLEMKRQFLLNPSYFGNRHPQIASALAKVPELF
jgi:uncharacterized protein (TIGR02646 family)